MCHQLRPSFIFLPGYFGQGHSSPSVNVSLSLVLEKTLGPFCASSLLTSPPTTEGSGRVSLGCMESLLSCLSCLLALWFLNLHSSLSTQVSLWPQQTVIPSSVRKELHHSLPDISNCVSSLQVEYSHFGFHGQINSRCSRTKQCSI